VHYNRKNDVGKLFVWKPLLIDQSINKYDQAISRQKLYIV